MKQNLFSGISSKLRDERIDELVASPGLRIERIVSTGHASPPGFWCDQPGSEWVVVLSGSAGAAD
jgi:cupin 2 domain-containing protein